MQQKCGQSWRRRSSGNVRFETRSRNNLTKNKKLDVSVPLCWRLLLSHDVTFLPSVLYQKRFKKERRFRRRLEQELQLSTAAHMRDVGHGNSCAMDKRSNSPAGDRELVAAMQPPQQGQMSGGAGGSTGKGSPEAGSPATEPERPCSTEATVE